MNRWRLVKRFAVTKQTVVTYKYFVEATSKKFAAEAPIPPEAIVHEGRPTNGYITEVANEQGTGNSYSPPGWR